VQEPVLHLKQSDLLSIVDKAVKDALATRTHQHTPIEQVEPELAGRTREEGTLIITKGVETKGYQEWKFNDGTVRRDFK
jgi:hypothetical protein